MLRSFYLFIVFGGTMLSCNSVDNKHSAPVAQDTGLTAQLARQKARIDTLYEHSKGELITLVKQAGSKEPVQVFNDSLPDDEVEATYTLFKDSSGKISSISEFPFSQSGDWYIVLTHYFDPRGHTFAFERQTNFFNSGCTGGIAYETKTEYYDTAFRLVSSRYRLVDEENRPLNKDSCALLYEYEYKVYPQVKKYLDSLGWKRRPDAGRIQAL
jgi:hypothetical protein